MQIAVGPTTAASASEPSGDLDSHMSFLKASLVPQLQRGLEDHFRQQEVDVGAFDLKQMTFDAASMGVVDTYRRTTSYRRLLLGRMVSSLLCLSISSRGRLGISRTRRT